MVPHKPFEVRCFLRHRGGMRLSLRELVPVVPGGARLEGGEHVAGLALEPNARTDFTFRLIAPAAGRVVLHGLAVTLPGPLGLFCVPLYFPNPLVIKVLPQAAQRSRAAPRTITGLPVERSGASLLRPAGSGTELRELRELMPGDPFKSIAWKASARMGRLMVRAVEQEVQETRYVIVDVSGTMRGGEPGRRKIDFAVEAAAAEARRALDAGDRIGLVTVDGPPPGARRGQRRAPPDAQGLRGAARRHRGGGRGPHGDRRRRGRGRGRPLRPAAGRRRLQPRRRQGVERADAGAARRRGAAGRRGSREGAREQPGRRAAAALLPRARDPPALPPRPARRRQGAGAGGGAARRPEGACVPRCRSW
ncbi:MAG: DUF58 domain-containing protein [Sandaracinaceae bacterium]|nr:DUF58 domain-containing protein [Sandaracinaceae bacterium]